MSAGHRRRLGDVAADLGSALRRRIWLLLGIAIPLFVVAVIVISMLQPRYDATTRIRIDPSRNPMAEDQAQSMVNSEAIETEIGVMTSLELARTVVKTLHLDQDPTFTRGLPPAGQMSETERLNIVARRVMQNLAVGRDKLSYLIAMSYRARDPNKAADIANAFADDYIKLRVGSQVGTSERQADFFRDRLSDLGREVRAAESALASYRARNGISSNTTEGTVVDEQIGSLSSQLATAEATAAAARSKASIAAAQVARGGLDAVSEVRNSNVISDLRRQRAEIIRNMGEVQARYGDKHPESIRVRDQLKAVDAQITDEAARVVNSLKADANAADAQVASLRSSMRGLEGDRAKNTRASAEALGLEREAASKRAAYDRMSQLSLDSTQSARGSIAQAEIVDRARPPSAPTSPNRKLLIVLAAVVAIATGLGVVLVLEMFQGGFRTIAEVEDELNLPVLGSIPIEGSRRRIGKSGRSPADGVLGNRATMYSEAIRNVRASIVGHGQSVSPTVVAFTSALPDEGKTTLALSFARMAAINSMRTLLIDCDLRNAGLRKITSSSIPENDVIQVLEGTCPLSQAVAPDQVPGLDLLGVSQPLFTSQDLFAHGAMERLLAEAKKSYDQIILDLPPVLGVADARTIATIADTTPLVVRWGKTPPKAVKLALTALEGDGAVVPGIVLSMVDPMSDAVGGFYYSSRYAKYYQSN